MKNKTGVLFGRLMRHILRNPDTIITVAIMPIMIMLLFSLWEFISAGRLQQANEARRCAGGFIFGVVGTTRHCLLN